MATCLTYRTTIFPNRVYNNSFVTSIVIVVSFLYNSCYVVTFSNAMVEWYHNYSAEVCQYGEQLYHYIYHTLLRHPDDVFIVHDKKP